MELQTLGRVEQELILIKLKVVVVEYEFRFSFKVTNNQTEYKTLLAGLKLAQELGMKKLRVFTDSARSWLSYR